MAIHYNAFISYRHHPDDIRVASEIHRALERFHVPRSILVRSPGATYSTVLSPDNGNPVDVRYQGEELLVLCDNSYLYRLDSAGHCLSQTLLDTDYSFTSFTLSGFHLTQEQNTAYGIQ